MRVLPVNATSYSLATERKMLNMYRRTRIQYTETDKALMWDRGKEVADHQRFTLATDIKVYFRDPQSPWQLGSNENTRSSMTILSEGSRPIVAVSSLT